MRKIINRKIYDTSLATLICFDDSINLGNCTRASNLYKTKKGNFFIHHETAWESEFDYIRPMDADDAVDFFEECRYTEVSFEEAFPNVVLTEA